MERTDTLIYKITTKNLWDRAEAEGVLPPSPVDVADGFMHFSTAAQLRETLSRHFRGRSGLMLLTIDSALVPTDFVWEPSRGGALFPHLYAPLPRAAVIAARQIAVDETGHADLPGVRT